MYVLLYEMLFGSFVLCNCSSIEFRDSCGPRKEVDSVIICLSVYLRGGDGKMCGFELSHAHVIESSSLAALWEAVRKEDES